MSTEQQKVAVVTGASSGIGLVAARTLASQGWHVIATGRNPERTARAEREIVAASNNGKVTMIRADLALLAEARRVAKEIAELSDRVDVLINNAGGIATAKVMTAEGLEENFAANHLGPFVLTQALLPLLRRAAAEAPKGSVRILNTASDASEMIPGLNLDDMQNLANYSPGLAYCSGKLANVLFARALAKRLAGDGIIAHAFHPGVVGTNFFAEFDEAAMTNVKTEEMQTPEQGADTLIWLATAEEPGATSGGYFYQRAPRTPNPVVDDADFVERFWLASEKLVAQV